mmetsp:Transcript_9465/g.27767  ORF Transcript_9465/g.27767 Transcript_9465/m.27767 type:complete len:226 (+) Transcript_9465:90-767(+)
MELRTNSAMAWSTSGPPRSWPPAWFLETTDAPPCTSRSRAQPLATAGKTGSLAPCVMSTRMPRWLGSRCAHWSTTSGAPDMNRTPAGFRSPWSATSKAVMAPWLKPPSTTLSKPTPPILQTSSINDCICTRHSFRPTGSSLMAAATPAPPGPCWLSVMNFITSSCHQAVCISGCSGACGNTKRTRFPGMRSIGASDARSLLLAPRPCSRITARSTLFVSPLTRHS